MTNWNERMRSEQERQIHQAEAIRIEAEKNESQRRASLSQKEEEKMRKLSKIARQGSKLFASFGVVEMLEGIGRDIWGVKARVEDVNSFHDVYSRMSDDHRGRSVAVVGKKLVYEYDRPERTTDKITKRTWGKHVVYGSHTSWGSGSDTTIETSSTVRGWYEKQIGFNVGYALHKERIEIGALLEGVTADARREDSPNSFSIRFIRDVREFPLDGLEDPRAFIETSFLNQCLMMQHLGERPSVLGANAQNRLAEIQQEMLGNPYKI